MNMVQQQKRRLYKKKRLQKKFVIIIIKYMNKFMNFLILILIILEELQLKNILKLYKIFLIKHIKMDICYHKK